MQNTKVTATRLARSAWALSSKHRRCDSQSKRITISGVATSTTSRTILAPHSIISVITKYGCGSSRRNVASRKRAKTALTFDPVDCSDHVWAVHAFSFICHLRELAGHLERAISEQRRVSRSCSSPWSFLPCLRLTHDAAQWAGRGHRQKRLRTNSKFAFSTLCMGTSGIWQDVRSCLLCQASFAPFVVVCAFLPSMVWVSSS